MMEAAQHRRIACMHRHMVQAGHPADSVSLHKPANIDVLGARAESPLPPHLTELSAQQLKDFVSRGLVIVPPEHQGVAFDHARLWEKMRALHAASKMPAVGYYDHFPELAELISGRAAPGLDQCMRAILGDDWAFQPFIHSMFAKTNAGGDQGWHKDDNAAYNARKMRHHRPVQSELLYYPQATTLMNGPTYVVPYSHYWTTNHESSEGNFSGPDHLDFWEQPAHDPAERVAQLEKSVQKLQWPLISSHAVQVPAGSFVIISHNTYHRGSRKLDSVDNPDADPRFMWRMYCYRTTEPPKAPKECTLVAFGKWTDKKMDELTGQRLGDKTPREAMEIWDAMLTYAAGLSPPVVGSSGSGTDSTLLQGLRAVGEQAEPQRVGSAYALAKAGNIHALCKGLHSERENVRRAAAYGLATLSDHLAENAVPLLVELCKSAAKSTRKYASFVLGEMAPLSPPVVKTLTNLLLKDESAYVRHCAGGALGCCGIRAIAQKQGLNELSSVIEAFVQSLEIEENRVDVEIRQGLDLKRCAPDDLCDICEGSTWHVGAGYPLEPKLEPVRSAVRENVLWSCCQLCTHALEANHGAQMLVEALETVCVTDTNVCSIGYAMDALHRLQLRSSVGASAKLALGRAHSQLAVRCPETLARTQPDGFDLSSPDLWPQLSS